jgi:glycosyltransferase involved in cell wall biosynthesis
MKTKKPSAIIYGWYRQGEEILTSGVYWEDGLMDDVQIYSIPYTDNVLDDYNKYEPDIILSFIDQINVPHITLKNIHIHYDEYIDEQIMANVIVCQTVFRHTNYIRPRFSIFTSTYKTGDRIKRTYESLKNQTLTNWEWVVIDDSDDDETFNLLQEISKTDYRVKLHKIYPLTGGNIGLAKHRAAMLCDGDWLVELDHDDALISNCLEICNDAILTYPDAGFLYSDVCELYEDGEMKSYDHDWSGNWYAREDNYFDFGYAGHTWVEADGKQYLSHWYPDINPLTIRFNISMPDHVRIWERNLYHRIGGHNKKTPVADDFELIVRTFLHTRFIHVKRMLYLQYNNQNSTVDNNSTDINRRARLIKDHYDLAIHNRILQLGYNDWNWDEELQHSQKFQSRTPIRKYFGEEEVMNYIYK